MLAVGFNDRSVQSFSVVIGRSRKVMEVYGSINLLCFGNRVWTDRFKEIKSVCAVSRPIELRLPYSGFSVTEIYYASVAKVQEIYCGFMAHTKMYLQVVVASGMLRFLINKNAAFTVEQACKISIHGFLARVFSGMAALAGEKEIVKRAGSRPWEPVRGGCSLNTHHCTRLLIERY